MATISITSALAVALASLFSASHPGDISPNSRLENTISVASANVLAKDGAESRDYLRGGVVVPMATQPDQNFLLFEVLQMQNVDASPHVASLAVNRITGEVWDTADHCFYLDSRRLTEGRKRLIKAATIPQATLDRFLHLKPSCDAD